MVLKKRSPDQTAISVSLPVELLSDIDERAKSLGLNRSQYLAQLAKQDLAMGGDFKIFTKPTVSSNQAPKEDGSALIDREVGKILSNAKRDRKK